MQQFHGRPAIRERRGDDNTIHHISKERNEFFQDRRLSGEPAKYNTRSTLRRIIWENDLYERQSI